MRNFIIIIGGIVVLAASLVFLGRGMQPSGQTNNQSKTTMLLTSPSFQNGGDIPGIFTCTGQGRSPELHIENIPANAESLTLIMHDPDAPLPGGFTHWLAWNIDPKTSVIPEGGPLPAGSIEGLNGAKKTGYLGPCPPSGAHRYYFYLSALDAKLDLAGNATKQELEDAVAKHIVAQTELMGIYAKP